MFFVKPQVLSVPSDCKCDADNLNDQICLHHVTFQTLAAGGGTGAYPPGASRVGAPEGGAVIFLRHEIYKNSVSSAKAVMGMEEQITCIEKCTF